MRTIRWNKTVLAVICSVLILFVLCRVQYYDYVTHGSIKNTSVQGVWDFVADFRNMKFLQPYMQKFTILSESGNYDKWKYSVKYYEPLSDWPHWDTVNVADYVVRNDGHLYTVSSTHQTCFLNEWICINTKSEFELKQVGLDTHYREIISYQCPSILNKICHDQVDNSRTMYLQRLHEKFSP